MRRTLQGRPHQPRAVPSRPQPGSASAQRSSPALVLAGARSQPMPAMLSGSLTCAAGQATHPCATFVRRLGSDKGLYVVYAPYAPELTK